MGSREWWLIDISGYGDFAFYGTPLEAEDMRKHKAAWEGGSGVKKRINSQHQQAQNDISRQWWEFDHGYPMQSTDPRLIELREKHSRFNGRYQKDSPDGR